MADEDLDDVGVGFVLSAPDRLKNLVTRDHAASIRDQEGEQVVTLLRELSSLGGAFDSEPGSVPGAPSGGALPGNCARQ